MVGSEFCCFSWCWPVQVRVTSGGNYFFPSTPPQTTTWFLQHCEPGPTFFRCRTSNLDTNNICTLNEIAQKVGSFSYSCLSCFLTCCSHTHRVTQLWFWFWETRIRVWCLMDDQAKLKHISRSRFILSTEELKCSICKPTLVRLVMFWKYSLWISSNKLLGLPPSMETGFLFWG